MAKMPRLRDAAEADRLLSRTDPPDAVYAAEEVLGVAMLNAAHRNGVRVPDDLLLAVAADREPADADIPLTTLELDPARTASEAIDLLVDVIEGRPPPERERLIATNLVPRESTRARASGFKPDA
jgi:DNA-binding LacI/PurR family transcriptional regulator